VSCISITRHTAHNIISYPQTSVLQTSVSYTNMQYLTILALTAAVSAIDIRGHSESHCGGNSVTWYNANADTCYATGGIQYAFSFAAIPTNWAIQTRIYLEGNCNKESWTARSNGRDYVCMGAEVNNWLYTGAGYGFNGKKRSEGVSSDGRDCVKPDLLTMVDGQTYALEGIDETELKTMVS
jgi:hypothetical protein